MHVYVINGAPTSGKSTFVSVIHKLMMDTCKEVSTVDLVKDIADQCGWDGQKHPKDRKFLSDLKNLLTEWNDIPIKDIKKRYDAFLRYLDNWEYDSEDAAFFIHSREYPEIQRLKREFGAKSILIRRPEVENIPQSNNSDKIDFSKNYDIIINNDGDLRDLAFKAIDFITNENLSCVTNRNIEVGLDGSITFY